MRIQSFYIHILLVIKYLVNPGRVLAIVACLLLLAEYTHSSFEGHLAHHVPERHYFNNWGFTTVSNISGASTTTTVLPDNWVIKTLN